MTLIPGLPFQSHGCREPGRGRLGRFTSPCATARLALVACAALAGAGVAQGEGPDLIRGEVRFTPTAQEAGTAAPFRLPEHRFAFEQEPLPTASQTMLLSAVRFPSPVTTPHAENNTVHCEYFCPRDARGAPGVVVLHILGGDFDLARLVCRQLAAHGVAALFVKMPYYGPRRPKDAQQARMVTLDPRQTVRGMQQAVLDIRRAAAWLGAREEIDPQQLGITGISLGGITACLAACAEPRFQKTALVLAGGDIAAVAWDSPRVAEVRRYWLAQGETHESFLALMKSVDPVTYADRLRGREIRMINARYDNEIPPVCSESLWRALGEPPIVWMETNHYTAIRHLFDNLAEMTRFFQPRPR